MWKVHRSQKAAEWALVQFRRSLFLSSTIRSSERSMKFLSLFGHDLVAPDLLIRNKSHEVREIMPRLRDLAYGLPLLAPVEDSTQSMNSAF